MSTTQPIDPTPFSVGTENCESKSVRVIVDGTEIPVVESSEMRDDEVAVEVQVRTDGPAAITRLSDVHFPAYWRGEDVFDELNLSESTERSVPVTIQARPPINSNVDREWRTVHHGWLHKIGSGGNGRLLRMRVSDYANIASNTSVTAQYRNTEVKTVLSDMVERLYEKSQMPAVRLNDLPSTDVASYTPYEPVGSVYVSNLIRDALLGKKPTSKTFQAVNGDTVADVLNWIADITDTVWFFSPTDRGLSLNFIPDSELVTEYESRQTGGDVYIHRNQALYNIDPINRVTTIGEEVDISKETSGNVYYTAKATHWPLYESADRSANEKLERGKFSSIDEAKRVATRKLKEQYTHNNEGTIVADGRPELLPYNRISAVPICNDLVDTSINPLTYQIKEVTHKFATRGRYKTELNVGIAAIDEDILTLGGYGEKDGDVVYSELGAKISGEQLEDGEYIPEGPSVL